MSHGIFSKIIHDHLDEFVIKFPTSYHEQKVLGAIAQCRTGKLGYYVTECEQCSTKMVLPRSCGNRHCPTCGNGNKELWLYNQSHYMDIFGICVMRKSMITIDVLTLLV